MESEEIEIDFQISSHFISDDDSEYSSDSEDLNFIKVEELESNKKKKLYLKEIYLQL